VLLICLCNAYPKISKSFKADFIFAVFSNKTSYLMFTNAWVDFDNSRSKYIDHNIPNPISYIHRYDESKYFEFDPISKSCSVHADASISYDWFSWVNQTTADGACQLNGQTGSRWVFKARDKDSILCYSDKFQMPLEISFFDRTPDQFHHTFISFVTYKVVTKFPQNMFTPPSYCSSSSSTIEKEQPVNSISSASIISQYI